MMRPPETELTVLVDDVRTFRDGRPALLARTSGEALALFDQLADRRIDHLWLDFELIGDDTAQPVVDHLVRTASTGNPVDIGQIHIHTACIREGHQMGLDLKKAGYTVAVSYAARMWRHTNYGPDSKTT